MKRILIAGAVTLVAGTAWLTNQLAPGNEASQVGDENASEQARPSRPTRAPMLERIGARPKSQAPSPAVALDSPLVDEVNGTVPRTVEALAAERSEEERATGMTTEELEFEFDSEMGQRDLHEVEGAIERVVATVESPGTRLERVECRETMCRAELTFDDQGTEREFFDQFMYPQERTADTTRLRAMSGIIPSREKYEDGSRRIVMYLHGSANAL